MTVQPNVTAIVTCMTDQERPFVRAAIRSVANQTIPCAIRLYVREDNDWIDDAIADLTPIEVRRVPSMNSASVRNLGVEEAETKYVAFLDSDDVWFPTKTEEQLKVAESLGVPFVGADHVMVTEEGRRFAFGAAKYLPMTSSWLVLRDYMRRFPFNEQIFRREDKEWWHRRRHNAPRHRLPKFLIAYRVRLSSKSAQTRANRKVRLYQLSTKRGLGLAILGASWLHHRLHRRSFYLDYPSLDLRGVQDEPSHGPSQPVVLKEQKP